MLSSIPIPIQESLQEKLNSGLKEFTFSGGGCINHGGKLKTTSGDFFLKWNDAKKFPGMFEAEAKGLTLLSDANAVHVPDVVHVDQAGMHQFLLLQFIEQKPKQPDYWEVLADELSLLHKSSSPTFGLDHDNYIGSLHQQNNREWNWLDFFIKYRLDVQVKLSIDDDKLDKRTILQFESLYKKLPDVFPKEKPSLLHGDLWSGNLITDSEGHPALIDPAVYYGQREAEIAFTKLFGGFSDRFYDAYQNSFPLDEGFENRVDLYNLYPLLVHVNLFGGGYVSQVVSILRSFV